MQQRQSFPVLGLSLYAIGVAVGLLVIVIATWADIESSSYGFPRLASAGLGGLHCPILMTRAETGLISLDVSNPTDRQISPSIKTQISTPLLPEEFNENLRLAPGESKRLEWPVTSDNIDLGQFILAKVLLYSANPLPSREATCGIFVIDLPGAGRVILPVLVLFSLLGMGWGLYQVNRRHMSDRWLGKHRGSMTFLGLLIGFGLFQSYAGGWSLSLLVLIVSVLLVLIIVSSLVADISK